MSTDRVKGKVLQFIRSKGFGFITPEDGGDKVFLHWENIVTDDNWPFIKKGTEVEFLVEYNDGKPRAIEVTLVGGEKIPVFTKRYEDREVNEEETYTGVIKFFDRLNGFGFVKPDEKIIFQGEESGEGLYFARDDILTGNAGKGMLLRVNKGLRVSYKVYKGKKGLGACEVQNEDMTPLEYQPRIEGGNRKRTRKGDGNKKSSKKAKTKEQLIEERENDEDEKVYIGTVKSYMPDKEFGFITLSEEITFKGVTVKKDRIFVRKEDIVCYSDEVGLNVSAEVMFKVYRDSMGLGACEVMNIDGTPIDYNS